MSRAIIIRPYHATDWPRLCEIHDAARLDELRLTVGEAAFLSLDQAAESEGLFDGRGAVAVLDERVWGFVAFTDSELNWLYVDPDSYRRGIGRALLHHAIENAGLTLTLEVLEGNGPALQLYGSEGFQVLRRVDGALYGNEEFRAAGFVLEYRKHKL